MDESKLDLFLVDLLIDDYGWDEDKAESAVAAWRSSGSVHSELDAPYIAEHIWNASE
ncbi:MAG TPA: hypothetical protein H9902_02710 [Candidatus Stackebrandtia faecavium]|nr:hypothetical protein [Candidatus Stackebrandtia faecavium]